MQPSLETKLRGAWQSRGNNGRIGFVSWTKRIAINDYSDLQDAAKTYLEDRRLLKYAGMMGHTFVALVGSPTERRINCETFDLMEALRIAGNDTEPRYYKKIARTSRGSKEKKYSWKEVQAELL